MSRLRRVLLNSARHLIAVLVTLVVTTGEPAAQEYLQLRLEPTVATLDRGEGAAEEKLRVLAGADQVWLAAGDLAALLQGTLYWRPEVQKLAFDVGGHRLQFSVGAEIVQLDGEESIHLPGPVFLREGLIFLPLAAFLDASGRPYPWIPVALRWDPAARRLDLGTPRHALRGVALVPGPDGERLEVVLERPVDARVELAGRARTRIRLPGLAVNPDSVRLPAAGERFLAVTLDDDADGATLSFGTTPDIVGFSLQRLERPPRIAVTLTDDPEAVREGRFRPFPESGLADTLALAVVALDPGGGGDASDRGGDLALYLARALARRLEDSLGVRVVLTRDEDRALSDTDRVELANTARADLFLSLHYARDPRAPRAVIARAASRRNVGVARPLADLGFATWGQGSRDTGEASRRLGGLLVDALRRELGLETGADFEGTGGATAAAGEEEGSGSVVEWPVPLLQAATMPAVYLIVEDLGQSGASRLDDPGRLDRTVAALLDAIRTWRISAP